jgi:glucose/arabinose dehydrogenase
VAALKASRLMFMRFDASGRFLVVNTPRALTRFGRLRSVTNMPNGDLLVTTSNGGSHDVVLRVHPGR